MWKWLTRSANQKALALLGTGIAGVAVAVWTVFAHFNANKPSPTVEVGGSGIGIIEGGVSDSTITAGVPPEELADAMKAYAEKDKMTPEQAMEAAEEKTNALVQAFETRDRQEDALRWASREMQYGYNQLRAGNFNDRTKDYYEAEEAFRKILEVYSQEDTPLEWAKAQNGLGLALASIGEREESEDHLAQAIDAYQKSLEIYTLEEHSGSWATLHANISGTYRILAEKNKDIAYAQQSLAFAKEASDVIASNEPKLYTPSYEMKKRRAKARIENITQLIDDLKNGQ